MNQLTLITVKARYQNRLALGIIAAYLRLFPKTTLDDLRRLFPKKEINSNAGVDELFVPVAEEHKHHSATWDGYFVDPAEVFTLADGTQIALTSMWPVDAINRLIAAVAPYGIVATLDQGPFPAPGYLLQFSVGLQLLIDVADDIRAFFISLQKPTPDLRNLILSEDDLKMRLAVWLTLRQRPDGKPRYDQVFTEYLVPATLLSGFPWSNDKIWIDIVVERGGLFVPIELKFILSKLTIQLPRFGKALSVPFQADGNGACNDKSYSYWADVKRIELVKNSFSRQVPGGFALFVTNKGVHFKAPTPGSDYELFSTADGQHPTEKHWRKAPVGDKLKKKPDFDVDRAYDIRWEKTQLEGQPCRFSLLQI